MGSFLAFAPPECGTLPFEGCFAPDFCEPAPAGLSERGFAGPFKDGFLTVVPDVPALGRGLTGDFGAGKGGFGLALGALGGAPGKVTVTVAAACSEI